MSAEGEDRPPRRPGGDDAPKYTVYGKDGEERPQPAPRKKTDSRSGKDPARPEYKVYRSRPGVRDRLRKPDMAGLRKMRGSGGGGGSSLRDRLTGGGGKRPWVGRVLIAIFGWLLL